LSQVTRPVRFALSPDFIARQPRRRAGFSPERLRSETSVCGPKEASTRGSQAARASPGERGSLIPPRALNLSVPLPSSGLVSELTFVNTRVGSPARWQSSRYRPLRAPPDARVSRRCCHAGRCRDALVGTPRLVRSRGAGFWIRLKGGRLGDTAQMAIEQVPPSGEDGASAFRAI
jgi:hypothetical protein